MKTVILSLICALLLPLWACGDQESPAAGGGSATSRPTSGDWRAAATAARERGAAWLAAQAKEGRWGFAPGQPHVGITALASLALIRSRGPEEVARLDATLDWIASHQKPDGSIHGGDLATYNTSLAMLVLKAAGRPRHASVVGRGLEYLKRVQLDEEEGYEKSSEYYGGIGYEKKRDDPRKPNPNLSTTTWALEAAQAAGLPKDDAFYKKALVFLQRSQNRSETNDKVHDTGAGRVESGNDGGAIYQPWDSKAGVETRPDGRKIFRSYGSMSYALLRSYLFCDLDARDPRVRAVQDWLGRHWTVEANPGMEHLDEPGSQYMGLYYYWLTIGRTLGAAETRGRSLGGTPLAGWREQVARALVGAQRADGTWINSRNDRWWEGSPHLVTAYALLTLSDCLGP